MKYDLSRRKSSTRETGWRYIKVGHPIDGELMLFHSTDLEAV
jgi:hypothetical protein